MGIELIEDLGTQYATESSKKKEHFGLYLCSCGVEFRSTIGNARRGNNSCGCYRRSMFTTHGLCGHPLYNTWAGMKARTTNPKSANYHHYGGRGITMCPEWLESPQIFFDWSEANGYSPGLSVDRINNDLGYSPENCRWATRNVQNRNTRRLMSTNTSGYRGIYFSKPRGVWLATICINYKTRQLGAFPTALEAAQAYDNYIIENNLEHTKNFEEDE